MNSLYELLNKEIISLGLDNYSNLDFLSDRAACAKFIDTLAGQYWDVNNEITVPYHVAQNRASHSIITFLMGRALCRVSGHIDKIKNDKDEYSRLWMLTSINHDRGYFSKLLNNPQKSKKDFEKDNLFCQKYTDSRLSQFNDFQKKHSKYLAYTVPEIEAYAEYAISFHAEQINDDEKQDHGILGGLLIFYYGKNEYMKNNCSSKELLLIMKSGYTIAQHNIFKSPDEDTDSKYPHILLEKLSHDSKFRIGQNKTTQLLLLLCLVDTVECVKKMGKGEDSHNYLETKTVLQGIGIEVCNNGIILDYVNLYKKIHRDKKQEQVDILFERLNSCYNNVRSLPQWTVFDVTEDGEHRLRIELKQ